MDHKLNILPVEILRMISEYLEYKCRVCYRTLVLGKDRIYRTQYRFRYCSEECWLHI